MAVTVHRPGEQVTVQCKTGRSWTTVQVFPIAWSAEDEAECEYSAHRLARILHTEGRTVRIVRDICTR